MMIMTNSVTRGREPSKRMAQIAYVLNSIKENISEYPTLSEIRTLANEAQRECAADKDFDVNQSTVGSKISVQLHGIGKSHSKIGCGKFYDLVYTWLAQNDPAPLRDLLCDNCARGHETADELLIRKIVV